MRKLKEYTLYKGEKILATGTIKEIAEKMKVKEKSICFYGTPCYLKRGKGEKSNNRRILVCLG